MLDQEREAVVTDVEGDPPPCLELPSGAALDPIQLEDYDDWIFGMAAIGDGELVVSGPNWGRTLVVFDARTGSRIRELALDRPAIDLSCVSVTM